MPPAPSLRRPAADSRRFVLARWRGPPPRIMLVSAGRETSVHVEGDMRDSFGLARLVVLGIALVACVRAGSVAPQNGGHYMIDAAELEQVADLTLYDAVHRLRPHFLRSRAQTAQGRAHYPLNLYVDGDRMDSLDDLRRLSAADALEVRFYEPQLANAHFGRFNNAGGAIAVTLKKS